MPSFAETFGALALLLPFGGMSVDAPVSNAPAVSSATEPAQAGDTPKFPEAIEYPVSYTHLTLPTILLV